jgi:hypothetical protein
MLLVSQKLMKIGLALTTTAKMEIVMINNKITQSIRPSPPA